MNKPASSAFCISMKRLNLSVLALISVCSNCFSFRPVAVPRQASTVRTAGVPPPNDNALMFLETLGTESSPSRRSLLVGSAAIVVAVASADPAVASSTGSSIPMWSLEGGVQMPVLALNTVGLSVEDTERAVALASRSGITHVDFHPGTERDGVARYLRNSGRRSDLFLNTKIRKAPEGISPEEAAERTRTQIEEDLQALGLKSVDMLMMRDSPDSGVIQAQWAVLEDALGKGQTRSLGVINFCQFSLNSVLETAKVKPALNYIMVHVGMGVDPGALRSFGESRGIKTFGYGAVGEPRPSAELLLSPLLGHIAKVHDVTPEAVALRWVLQTGAAVSARPTTEFGLGTSVCPPQKCEEDIRARSSVFNWKLTEKEMAELSAVTSPNGNPTLFSSTGCPDSFVMPKK